MDTAQRGIALRKVLIVLLIVAVVTITATFIFQGSAKKPTDLGYRAVGDQFMTDITSDRAKAAYDLMAPELQEQKSEDTWIEVLNTSFSGYDKAKRFDESKVEDPDKVYGEAGGYVLKYRLGSGDTTYVVHALLRKMEGTWKVSEFLSNTPPLP